MDNQYLCTKYMFMFIEIRFQSFKLSILSEFGMKDLRW